MAAMRCAFLLRVTLMVLLAMSTAETLQKQWKVSVGDESPQGYNQLPLDGLSGEIPPGDDNPAVASVLHRYKRATTCGLSYNFTEAQKNEAVNVHNAVRRREGASNMMIMKWNDNLARLAHQWASQCEWKHGMTKYCDDSPIGQNLFMIKGGNTYPKLNITAVVDNGWWAEKKFFTYDKLTCVEGEQCGHYTQAVWAKSTEVGCSVVECPTVRVPKHDPWQTATYFACDYAPTGNYVGLKPYLKGTPCSKCSEVVEKGYICKNKLCEECSHKSNRKCKCIKLTCKRGRYNSKKCRCICPKGYWGVTCEKKCTCEDEYSTCPQYKDKCDVGAYFYTLRAHCSLTCPNTCEIPSKNDCKR